MNSIGDFHEDDFVEDCYQFVENALPIDQVQDFVEHIYTLFLVIDEDIQRYTEAPRNIQ
jgi:hypothetical protein